MKKQQSGFTLIELIAVLVILGILAATALPRFVDLSDAANEAVLEATAGAIESSSSLNYAVAVASNAGLTTDAFQNVTECNAASVNSLLTEALDFTDEFSIAVGTDFPADELGEIATCVLGSQSTGQVVNFTLIYATN